MNLTIAASSALVAAGLALAALELPADASVRLEPGLLTLPASLAPATGTIDIEPEAKPPKASVYKEGKGTQLLHIFEGEGKSDYFTVFHDHGTSLYITNDEGFWPYWVHSTEGDDKSVYTEKLDW